MIGTGPTRRPTRSIHVVPTIDNEASGPSYCVTRLCAGLAAHGEAVELAVLEPLPSGSDLAFARPFPYGTGPRKLGISPAMKRWLRREVAGGTVDIVHNHSLWMETNCYAAAAARGTPARLVVTPHGTLASHALGRRRLAKTALWPLMVGRATRGVAAFHATAEQEYEDIRRAGFRQPVAILPNGIDVPEAVERPRQARRQLLYFGRLHAIKGIDRLLRAWASLEGRHPDWDLVVAGPGEGGYEVELQTLKSNLALTRVSFPGPLYGTDKLEAYRTADLYVLPTHTENFGMTVAEALAAGTPVITTKGAPWAGLETEGAGWWVESSDEALLAALEAALAEPRDRLEARGRRGREWMIRDFGWDAISADMVHFYEWVALGGPSPAFVRID